MITYILRVWSSVLGVQSSEKMASSDWLNTICHCSLFTIRFFFRLFPELQAPNPELYFIHTDSFKQKGENYEKNSDRTGTAVFGIL